jgi:peptide-O-fucosyltransferase
MVHPLFGDESYIMWCLCMGRFGNQIDGFLGGLRVAKQLNRTLVVPSLVEYAVRPGGRRYPPFSDYFNVSRLGDFHRYIAMEDFVDKFSNDSSWNRTAFCWAKNSSAHYGESCDMRRGQPSTGFWDHYGIQFDESVFYDGSFASYPSERYPVIMLGGAPGNFPVEARDRELQKYVVFRDDILEEAAAVLRDVSKPVLSVHMRNSMDWKKACKHAVNRASWMESPQCLDGTNQLVTEEMCFPSFNDTLKRIRDVVQQTGARSVYVGADANPWVDELRRELAQGVEIVSNPFSGDSAYIRDQAVFSTTDSFLGNCISSFTGFAVRYRSINGLDSFFFGVDTVHAGEKVDTAGTLQVPDEESLQVPDKVSNEELKPLWIFDYSGIGLGVAVVGVLSLVVFRRMRASVLKRLRQRKQG